MVIYVVEKIINLVDEKFCLIKLDWLKTKR